MLLKFKQICDIEVLRLKPIYCRRFASGGGHGHGDDDDRRSWIWRGHDASDEYKDWIRFHKYMFILGTGITVWLGVFIGLWMKPDWPVGRDWARREAHLELTRRERAGLPL
uniref:NADH dehydrogenase [ubiquinone] 1 beta subcomplex subunit 11, mitochondrial n=1 Tax=Meloidogyne javanica TaxID=6303 RepID=A0A915LDM6_MELJA